MSQVSEKKVAFMKSMFLNREINKSWKLKLMLNLPFPANGTKILFC